MSDGLDAETNKLNLVRRLTKVGPSPLGAYMRDGLYIKSFSRCHDKRGAPI